MEIKDKIEIWKKAVEVQQHFNTIEMTLRNIFATIVVAILAGIGFTAKDGVFVSIGVVSVPGPVLICLAAIVLTFIFYFVDRFWYHRLLLGSVLEALELEKDLRNDGAILSLTKRIGEKSPLDCSKWPTWLLFVVNFALVRDQRLLVDKKNTFRWKDYYSLFVRNMAVRISCVRKCICANSKN